MAVTHIPNEAALQTVLIGTETRPGVAVTPTARLQGEFSATPGSGAIRRSVDATGGYDRTATLRRAQADPDGSYAEDLTYESFPTLMRYGVKGGGTGVSDANATPGYTYAKSPSFSTDDIDTATIMSGVPGLGWRSTGVRWDEFNIVADSTDADDTWKFSATPFMRDVVRLPGSIDAVATAATATTITWGTGTYTANQLAGAYITLNPESHTGQVRQILSNTATATGSTTLTVSTAFDPVPAATVPFHVAGQFPVIANPDYESITLEGTKLFLDLYNAGASTLGTTDVSERILAFNISNTLNLARKRRLPGIVGRTGRGAREISGTIRFEFDRWDEYRQWEEDDEISIRIEKEGSLIDTGAGSRKLARIDVERAAWDAFTPDTDNNNITMSLSFVALLPDNDPIATFTAKNTLVTLP